ncbi:MerR family transcriptional regulator [Streptomyces sp. 8K308]|uniref:MerR family transcriptional regulator n=1 Tax=Streptomyces sp. 8K308 TaxID=2530388 RepID=UPI0010455B01|nr:MerR family transcriptional regulator [Streptomyces sp. 8K308]TDC19318.1 MerR family transcriptional regulator [Streptomyces sp. 8K308]
MKIGELSRETGVAIRLLRYYEAQGLLTAERGEGGHRRYGPEAPVTVARIRALLAAGLPTRVIRSLMPCYTDDGARLQPCVLDHLRERAADLDTRMAELAEARAALGELVAAAAEPLTR